MPCPTACPPLAQQLEKQDGLWKEGVRGRHSPPPAFWGPWADFLHFARTAQGEVERRYLLCAPSRLLQVFLQTHLNKPLLPHKDVEYNEKSGGWAGFVISYLPAHQPSVLLSLSDGVFLSSNTSRGQGCGHPLGFIEMYCKFSCQVCTITAAQCITEQYSWEGTFRAASHSNQIPLGPAAQVLL